MTRDDVTVVAVDPADDPADSDARPILGTLRFAIGDDLGVVYIDVPRDEVDAMTAGRMGLEIFEMVKELDARSAAARDAADDALDGGV